MGVVSQILDRSWRRATVLAAFGLALILPSPIGAQTTTIVMPQGPLLPESVRTWKRSTSPSGTPAPSALQAPGSDLLKEAGERRHEDATYTAGGRQVHIFATEFGDATGAYSAFSLFLQPGMRVGKDVGVQSAIGSGAVLFQEGDTVVRAQPASAADLLDLRQIAVGLPKFSGNRSLQPLLPTYLPEKGLDRSSVRYALGPAQYSAMGGDLPPDIIGFSKAAEVATAHYAEASSKGVLTLLLFPTPQIAGDRGRAIEAHLNSSGATAGTAKLRREGPLIILATGFRPADAQELTENIHLRTQLTWNKPVPPEFHTEIQKTASLLVSIAVFCGVGALAAILLGLFLGGGRAAIRVMMGKPAATEPEFLRLGLLSSPDVPSTILPPGPEKS